MANAKHELDVFSLEPVEVYKLVLDGTLKKFPMYYLDKIKCKTILRYVVLEKYKYSREDILKLNRNFLSDNKMGGFKNFFDTQIYKMLSYSFPELEIKPWELTKVYPNYWKDKDNQKEFIIWVAEKEGLDLNSKQDLRKLTADVIQRYGGSKPLVHSGGEYELLKSVTGDKYKEWEIIAISSWSKEKAIDAVKWLVEERLNITLEQACDLKTSDFMENNLDGMLQKVFKHSILAALNTAYPNKFIRESARGIKCK